MQAMAATYQPTTSRHTSPLLLLLSLLLLPLVLALVSLLSLAGEWRRHCDSGSATSLVVVSGVQISTLVLFLPTLRDDSPKELKELLIIYEGKEVR